MYAPLPGNHGGGSFAFLVGRLALACQKRSWAPEFLKTEEGFAAEIAKLWFDVHVHDRRALALMVEVFGESRLVFGTNFAGWDQGELAEIGDLAPALVNNGKKLLRL